MTTISVPVRIAGELVINLADLSQIALEQIKGALTFINEDRIKAEREKLQGWWAMPETVALWRVEARRGGDGDVLCLPRGFATQLSAGLRSLGMEAVWDDQRALAPAADGYFRPFVLRDYQLAAMVDMLRAQQGFYQSPAGSGKTITLLAAACYANQRTIVVVDKAGLLEQWRIRAARVFGFAIDEVIGEDGEVHEVASLDGERTVGKIGEDVWEERDLTICLRQTFWSRHWELDASKWWANWGTTIFDEGHHLSADTMQEISRKVISCNLWATSATPAPSETRGKIVHALVGPVVHETPREVLYERGILMRPRVVVVDSEVDHAFWPTHDAWTEGDEIKCQMPGCRKAANGERHMHRNNWASVLKKLVEDAGRNKLIAETIVGERGHIHLVGSRQLKHLDAIKKACIEAGWPKDKIWMLRGEENARGESQKIAQEVERAGEAIIFSTVADEGLDIPPIDRVHVVFPVRAEHAIIQYVGRGERVWPTKTDSVIYDYRDAQTTVFADQFNERERVYRMMGFTQRAPKPAPSTEADQDHAEPAAQESKVMIG